MLYQRIFPIKYYKIGENSERPVSIQSFFKVRTLLGTLGWGPISLNVRVRPRPSEQRSRGSGVTQEEKRLSVHTAWLAYIGTGDGAWWGARA